MNTLKEVAFQALCWACYAFGLVLGLIIAFLMMCFSYTVYPYPYP